MLGFQTSNNSYSASAGCGRILSIEGPQGPPALVARRVQVISGPGVTGNTRWFCLGLAPREAEEALDRMRHAADLASSRIPIEVREFVVRHGLGQYLDRAITAARRHFGRISSMRIYLDQDPEDHDEYVMLEVNSNGDPSGDMDSYFKYMDEWSASVEWPASRLISLDLNTLALSASR